MEKLTLFDLHNKKCIIWRFLALILYCLPTVAATDCTQTSSDTAYIAIWLTVAFSLTSIATTVIVGICLYLRFTRALKIHVQLRNTLPSNEEVVHDEERSPPPITITKTVESEEGINKQLDSSVYSASDNLYIPTTHLYEAFVNNPEMPRRDSIIHLTSPDEALNNITVTEELNSSEQNSVLYDNVNKD